MILEIFRQEAQTWLEENSPEAMRTPQREDEIVWGGRNATLAFHRVSSEAIQLHSGIDMTDAEDIGFSLMRARVGRQAFGDAKYHQSLYARLSGF